MKTETTRPTSTMTGTLLTLNQKNFGFTYFELSDKSLIDLYPFIDNSWDQIYEEKNHF